MPEINLKGIFIGTKWWMALAIIIVALSYIFKDTISNLVSPQNELILVEQAAALTDDDILSAGYWKLNEEGTVWECQLSFSLYRYDFCNQTGSFANDSFVKSFQVRLEHNDVIIVTIRPDEDPNSSFNKYWRPIYSSVYTEENWGEPLYVIYFQVGDTNNMRRVIYTKDKGDAREGRIFTTHFEELILDTLE